MTTTTEKRSGMKRDIIKLVCHKYMDKSHTTNKFTASIPLSGDTTAKLYFLQKGRSHSGSALLNKRSLNLLRLLLLRRLFISFVAISSVSSITKRGLQTLIDSG